MKDTVSCNEGSDACSVMVVMFIFLSYGHYHALFVFPSVIEAQMYNCFCTFIVYV